MGRGTPVRESDALSELINNMPIQLFDGYREDAEFHRLVRHLAKEKVSYPQALEEMVKYYLGVRKIERDKAIEDVQNSIARPMVVDKSDVSETLLKMMKL
ncbi:hypothetical protein [Alteromonas mediterranea]|jgi:hypothetical protein|uniref:hypothetical protein n=1 Tax=Alteromonas mediterranea TaxID=314275 RepID=UPI00029887E2|nr:hypothetical protein [Alteromonas mediterranea]AFV85261.1 hypothetical protein amad1_08750 [Alteromonas mediterranea DE1]AGP97272.1 hypothetical protein I635_08740 [Alteromonas mediterranea UM7]AMJ82505.1 hypothetical protein AV941_08690 [Alteromonas mediterranea]